MTQRRTRRITSPVAALAALLMASGLFAQSSAPASALTLLDPTEQQVGQFLTEHPNATRSAKYQVSFASGAVLLNFVPPGQTHVTNEASLRPELRQTPEETARSARTATAAAVDWHGCPNSVTTAWYCVYENANWGGRMLEFKDCTSSGYYNYLNQYGFLNMTTSWVNTKPLSTVNAYSSTGYLWTEPPRSMSSNVGAANNDRAYYLVCTNS